MATIFECENASKDYGGLQAVKDLTFSVEEGEIYAIAGPNGAGKTTLFDTITGVASLTSGVIRFDGREIQRMHPDSICRLGIARTFQTTVGLRHPDGADQRAGGRDPGPARAPATPPCASRTKPSRPPWMRWSSATCCTCSASEVSKLPVFDRKRLMLATALCHQAQAAAAGRAGGRPQPIRSARR